MTLAFPLPEHYQAKQPEDQPIQTNIYDSPHRITIAIQEADVVELGGDACPFCTEGWLL